MIARAGPGAAGYPRGIQTWNGTRPTLIVNPANSSVSAASRAVPPPTCVNDARLSEWDRAASSSSPTSRAAPLTRPKTRVMNAPSGRPRRPRSKPASR